MGFNGGGVIFWGLWYLWYGWVSVGRIGEIKLGWVNFCSGSFFWY